VTAEPRDVQQPVQTVAVHTMSSALRTGRHSAPEADWDRIASGSDLDRPGRHAEPDGDSPIYDALRDELAAVDWFSLGRD
jgi:hypothetical protein